MRKKMMTAADFDPTFLSCEKDFESILERLFVQSGAYGEKLKRLLVLNTKDCLDNYDSKVYHDKIAEMTLPKLYQDGYLVITPKVSRSEHEEVKSYLAIGFDNFGETLNPQFRDCLLTIDIICETDCWDLGNFRLRPLKIAGYIDGILNRARFSGIGTLEFIACKELVLDETISGYTLVYRAVHGSDDKLEK